MHLAQQLELPPHSPTAREILSSFFIDREATNTRQTDVDWAVQVCRHQCCRLPPPSQAAPPNSSCEFAHFDAVTAGKCRQRAHVVSGLLNDLLAFAAMTYDERLHSQEPHRRPNGDGLLHIVADGFLEAMLQWVLGSADAIQAIVSLAESPCLT